MHDNNQSKFTSPNIAKEMKKKFGNQAETVTVTMKYRKQVGAFVKKIEKAHKKAGKSKLLFT
ncbi:MAG: hypothetical protein GXP49_14640 [Deltaproteobacteria bacterium]|nr:hypothetical protein [Deltaproteobacteria bacterium]